MALIDRGQIRWAKAFGKEVTPHTLYQAASLSKFVAALGAMKLVEQGSLALDSDVNDALASWHLPANEFDAEHKVTLRELLGMTGGVNVPGYQGYARDAKLPTPLQILEGAPPANSPPVDVIAVPGTSYHYSGGGYQIIEAMVADATHKSFADAMQELVLGPAKMSNSVWAPLPARMEKKAAKAHLADGGEVQGGWHVYPELAAAGLWSTATDLAKLLIALGQAWQGRKHTLLGQETARQILTQVSVGPYGLGVDGNGKALVLTKAGINLGYQSFLIVYPATGQGLVVMSNSEHGEVLCKALIRRAATLYGWPEVGDLIE
jgi:CubicO group peptidase (beta-lactamase class C family)